jgi:hypothetical protein
MEPQQAGLEGSHGPMLLICVPTGILARAGTRRKSPAARFDGAPSSWGPSGFPGSCPSTMPTVIPSFALWRKPAVVGISTRARGQPDEIAPNRSLIAASRKKLTRSRGGRGRADLSERVVRK